MSSFHYVGSELELFQEARNWKKYFSSFFIPHIGGKVLEVGAGLGANTSLLCQKGHPLWLCLEPDEKMAKILETKVQNHSLPSCCQVKHGFLQDLPHHERFDTILYIDVLEHIEKDQEEFDRAVQHLQTGGKLMVLAPAHPFLYSPFDKAIGHYRRYNRKTFFSLTSKGIELIDWRYLDSWGAILLWAKQRLRPAQYPTEIEIKIWDTFFIPLSRIMDFCLFYRFGKTLVGVWEKKG